MPDSTHAVMYSLVIQEESDLDRANAGHDKIREKVAASEHRIADLERELGKATEQEAETALQLDTERTRRGALDEKLHQARNEANSLMLRAGFLHAGTQPPGEDDETGRQPFADSEGTATIARQRDRPAVEVAQLTNALAGKQVAIDEPPYLAVGTGRTGGTTLAQIERTAADVEDLAEIVQNDREEEAHTLEAVAVEDQPVGQSESTSQDEEAAADIDTLGLTRYESSSANLPSMGNDASEVTGSLQGLRESLRRH